MKKMILKKLNNICSCKKHHTISSNPDNMQKAPLACKVNETLSGAHPDRDEKKVTGELSVLITEYQNFHKIVDQHTQTSIHNTVQALVIIGAVLTFALPLYNDTKMAFFVNLSTLFLVPCVILCLIASMLSNSIKISTYGTFLSTIEKRINITLGYNNKPDGKAKDQIIDWEKWRLAHGFAKDLSVFYDGFLLFVLLFVAIIALIIHRVITLNNKCDSSLRIWIIVIPFYFSLFFSIFLDLLKKLKKSRHQLESFVNSEELDLDADPKTAGSTKKSSIRGGGRFLVKTLLIFLATEVIILSIFPFSFFQPNHDTLSLLTSPIAHRGLFNTNSPENSLDAFQNAIDAGFAVEMDIWFSKDNQPVVIHDEEIIDNNNIIRTVGELTLYEIQAISSKNGVQIPSLTDALKLIDGAVPVIIDIKDYFLSDDKCECLYRVIENYNGLFAIQSFSPFPLQWFKINHPDIIRGQLYGDWGKNPLRLIYTLRNNVFNYFSEPNYLGYDRNADDIVSWKQAKELSIPLVGWVFKVDELQQSSRNGYFDAFIVEE